MKKSDIQQDEATQYKVVWEKWSDPYNSDEDDKDWPDWNEDDDQGFVDEEQMVQLSMKDSFEDYMVEKNKKETKMIMTPAGIIPLNEYTSPSKIFNFWVGHTNFTITKPIEKLVENTDGVETLDIFTRYRMKVGIGKVFKPAVVMHNITTKLVDYMRQKKHART